MNGSGEMVYQERQQLAWIVLLASFFICFALTIAVPVGVGAALQNMKQTLPAIVQANQGTVRVDSDAGDSAVVIAGEGGLTLEPGGRVLTDETSTASLLIYAPDNPEAPLSRLQIYSRSSVTLEEANAPRFSVSDEVKRVGLYLDNGRLQLIVPEDSRRPIVFTVHTPHSQISILESGQYAILVDNEATRISVQAGQADALADGQSIRLRPAERAEIFVDGDIVGPLETSRDLVTNGDFQNDWDHWSLYVWNIELADQPDGQSRIVEVGGEPAVQFLREGIGHADVRLRQLISQDVADYEALRLLVTFRITDQSLGVCGVQGSECPLFLRINYSDDRGVKRTWQQGFFAQGEITPTTPDACISCAVIQDTHQRVALGQINFYETDLLEELARQGAPLPQFIDDVTIVSSGHGFQVEILDVSMMVEEGEIDN